MADLKEKIEDARSRSAEELKRLEDSEQSKKKKKKKAKPKPKEKVGTGTPAHESADDARIAMLKRKLEAIKDPNARKRLQEQIKSLREKK